MADRLQLGASLSPARKLDWAFCLLRVACSKEHLEGLEILVLRLSLQEIREDETLQPSFLLTT